jgi:hypothetical protein
MLLAWVLLAQVAAAGSPGAAGPQSAGAAAVPSGEVPSATSLPAPHSLRGGLVVGLALGAGLGGASGYPNDINQIGDPNYYSASGWMFGTSETLFVMGALTDYLNAGFFFGQATYRNADWRSTGAEGGLRLEVFPLAVVFPRLAGLGALAQFGIGGGNLTATGPAAAGLPPSDGTQSFADVGVFYEWAFGHLLGGHFAAGPALEYEAVWSQPFERHGLFASGRVAFYGAP